MRNSIKYSTLTQSLALRSGNFWIGTGDVGKGPTSSSDFWNGLTPQRNAYSVYINKASGGPAIHTANSDSELVAITNQTGGQSFTTAAQCLNWYASQSDRMVVNRDIFSISTNGLVCSLSGSFIPSFPRQNTIVYDLSGNSVNGTLVNGASYDTDGLGCFTFDGVNDSLSLPDGSNTRFPHNSAWTIQFTFKVNSFVNTYPGILIKGASSSSGVLIFYSSNGGLFWKHNNAQHQISSLATSGTVLNIAISYSGSGNVLGYVNGVYVGTLGTMSSTEAASPLLLGSGDQFGNQNLYEFHKYNRQLSGSEILSNFRHADPKMFASCKSANDLITNYPQLAGFDGLYWVYPGGPASSPYLVHCDMTTDGGGWMLVARSHPSVINYNGKNWGWKGGSIGSINDFSQSYQLGWGEIWDSAGVTFTSFIFGNQRTSVDNSWGPFIYKVSGINYATFFGSDTQQGYSNSTIKSDTSVYGTSSFPGMQGAVGFTTTATNNNFYYMRDCCGFAGYGAFPNQMVTTYCGANFYYAGPWCGGSSTTGSVYDYNSYVASGLTYGGTNQYMIMVK